MKFARVLTAAALLIAGTSGLASAYEVDLGWGACSGPNNADFVGPQTYNLVVSASGFDGTETNQNQQVILTLGPNLPDAWRFDAAGCQVGQLSVNTAGVSKACQAFAAGNQLPLIQYQFDQDSQRANLLASNGYDQPFTPAPGTQYTWWQFLFNHNFSVEGPADPNVACGGAEQPVGIELMLARLTTTDDELVNANAPDPCANWNDPNSTNCPLPVPGRDDTSWGRVKNLYR